MKFSRLILTIVHSNKNVEDNTRLVYIIEARNLNKKLLSKYINHHDNRSISIGFFIRFLCLFPIDQ